MNMKDFPWGIVVGLPKPEYWEASGTQPNKECIGEWLLSDWSNNGKQSFGRPNPDGTDSSVRCYRTRDEARKVAASLRNKAWLYTAKKFPISK